MASTCKDSKCKKCFVTNAFIYILRIYKLFISPMLHFISVGTVIGGCRFYPSCSEYSKQALAIYGAGFKSFKLILFRIIRCQPLRIFGNSSSGYDPIDNANNKRDRNS